MLTFLAVIHSSDESETISSTPSWNQTPMRTPSRGGHVALFWITMIARINLRARLRLCLVHAVKRNLGQADNFVGMSSLENTSQTCSFTKLYMMTSRGRQ